jgi:hypothetical protein
MRIAVEFFKKNFKNKDSKKAYLKACRWIAKNVISKNTEEEITTFQINKIPNDIPTFEVILYCCLDEIDIKESFCNACKEIHKSFFINENFNCNECKMNGYRNRCRKNITIKKKYREQRLSYLLNK